MKPEALGHTLTHEHLAMEFTHFYRQPPPQLTDKFEEAPKLNTVGYFRQYPYSWRGNLVLNDDEGKTAVLNDVAAYKKFGGGKFLIRALIFALILNPFFYKEIFANFLFD